MAKVRPRVLLIPVQTAWLPIKQELGDLARLLSDGGEVTVISRGTEDGLRRLIEEVKEGRMGFMAVVFEAMSGDHSVRQSLVEIARTELPLGVPLVRADKGKCQTQFTVVRRQTGQLGPHATTCDAMVDQAFLKLVETASAASLI